MWEVEGEVNEEDLTGSCMWEVDEEVKEEEEVEWYTTLLVMECACIVSVRTERCPRPRTSPG